MEAEDFYDQQRIAGYTYNITSNSNPNYHLEFYQEIFRTMEQYSLQELTEFLSYLLKNNYCDSDVYDEPPTAIDGYLELKRKKG